MLGAASPRSMRGLTPSAQVALAAREAGIGALPMRTDGSKQPALCGWKQYQRRLPEATELLSWFRRVGPGLALVTGAVSGGLIALDFDDAATFDAWLAHLRGNAGLWNLYEFIASGYEERTPKGGRHLLFRCPGAVEGNQKLALRPTSGSARFETLAETREEGGLIIIDPSRGGVHPSGKPYVRLRGSVATIRSIGADARARLYESVRALDETPPARELIPARGSTCLPHRHHANREGESRERPGDVFNRCVSWQELLVPLGWTLVRTDEQGESYWRHPGKVGPKHSATTNAGGCDLLCCFSPSAGLPTGRALDKFSFLAHWFHGGDFAAAARDLAAQGYGVPRKEVLTQA